MEELELGGALQVLLEALSHPEMHLALEAMEQPMLVVVVVDIGADEAVVPTAVAVAGLRTLIRVYSVWCTRRHIR